MIASLVARVDDRDLARFDHVLEKDVVARLRRFARVAAGHGGHLQIDHGTDRRVGGCWVGGVEGGGGNGGSAGRGGLDGGREK